MDILKIKKAHFIGLGGIGVSALASVLYYKGITISGSDNVESDITDEFKKKGIKFFNKQSEKNINKNLDIVIYSPAITKDNPELKEAIKLKIKCLSYPEALGQLTKKYHTIAICGTHGKSTTTAMLADILTNAKKDPTVVIGTKMKEFGNKNYRIGKSKYLLIEACEYKESFLNFSPKTIIITNIEADHLDYYKNLKNYIKAFELFAKKPAKSGKIIFDKNDKNSLLAIKNSKSKKISLSEKDKNSNFQLSKNILKNKDTKLTLTPSVPGSFNIKNAAMAAIVALDLGIDNHTIESSIKAFKGSWRRLEVRKVKNISTMFIDDYGHHPTEIKVTLHAIREKFKHSKILCIFQPHQYSRTKFFLKEFGKSFNEVNEVIIPNIYKVRDSEKDIKSTSREMLIKEIQKNNKNVLSEVEGLENTVEYIKKNHKKYDIIVTMGAGDIENIYKML